MSQSRRSDEVGVILGNDAFEEALNLHVHRDISDELVRDLSAAGVELDAVLAHSEDTSKMLLYLLKPESLELLARIVRMALARQEKKQLRVNLSTGELEAIGYSDRAAAEFLRILKQPPNAQDDSSSTS